MVPLVFSEGVHGRGLSLERFAQLFAGNAARIFGLERKGRIAVGADADFAFLDPRATWAIDDESLEYKNRWSPYRGMPATGRITRTIVRGRTVFREWKRRRRRRLRRVCGREPETSAAEEPA